MEIPTTIYGPNGALGPKFSYADQVASPQDIGVRAGGDFDAIQGALAGVSYYVDTIGFGSRSMVSKTLGAREQKPIGLRYFMKTGITCTNGKDMYEYVDSIPKGDALGKRIGDAIQGTLGVGLRGLGPGMVEDAKSALDPMPILNAVVGNAYPKCKQVRLPVGDQNGRTRSDEGDIWVETEGLEYNGSQPMQTRWILDSYVASNKETFTSDSNHSWNPLLAGGLAVGLGLVVAYTVAQRG